MDETHDDPDAPPVDENPRPAPQPRAVPVPVPVHPMLVEQPRPPRHLSRRWFVAGAAALVVGGGTGVAIDFARGRPPHAKPADPPAALIGALSEERTLLAAARAARRGRYPSKVPGAVVAALIRDHEAHLAALTAALASYSTVKRSAGAGQSGTAAPGDRAALRELERRAARGAAERANRLTGDTAALLASIAACEAAHAELLS